jgi:hypothetical protein
MLRLIYQVTQRLFWQVKIMTKQVDEEGYKLIYVEFPDEMNHLNYFKIKDMKVKLINKNQSKNGTKKTIPEILSRENP